MEHEMNEPQTDKALHIKTQCFGTEHICNKMDEGKLEKDFEQNQCQKIYTKDEKTLVLKYREQNSSQSSNKKIAILKKVSTFLRGRRRRTPKFMKDNSLKSKDFRVAFDEKQQQFSSKLASSMESIIFISKSWFQKRLNK